MNAQDLIALSVGEDRVVTEYPDTQEEESALLDELRARDDYESDVDCAPPSPRSRSPPLMLNTSATTIGRPCRSTASPSPFDATTEVTPPRMNKPKRRDV